MPKSLLRPMPKSDLRRAFDHLGWNTADKAADALSVSTRAVQYWLYESSERQIPGASAAIVRLLVAGRVTIYELGAA